ncbi:MAG: sugar phosphate isomerase/epimerase [Candidatus Omnitrophica bacterium]|nr:sugar phosphate isomerase/epimerase [Candidatus Omnitrophota bacterium]
MALGLSTSWNAFRYEEAGPLLFEIKNLGFSAVELSFNLTPAMVKEMENLCAEDQIKVLSLHNYCPIPEGLKREDALPDCYSLASANEAERALAIKHTQKTIDTARILGAEAVVLHCGRIEIPERTKNLIRLYANGKRDSEEFRGLRDKMIKERQGLSRPSFEKALKSLDILNAYASRCGISLGVETRFYFREIPSLEETGLILDKFKGGSIFYWHDTGHAQMMEDLGFTRHQDYLQLYGQNLLGVHLHNIVKGSDHQPPHKGEIDFKLLKPYLKEDTLKIIEAHQPSSAEDLKESKRFLEGLFNERN